MKVGRKIPLFTSADAIDWDFIPVKAGGEYESVMKTAKGEADRVKDKETPKKADTFDLRSSTVSAPQRVVSKFDLGVPKDGKAETKLGSESKPVAESLVKFEFGFGSSKTSATPKAEPVETQTESALKFAFGASTLSAVPKTLPQSIESKPAVDSSTKFDFGAAKDVQVSEADMKKETLPSGSFKFNFGASTLSVTPQSEPQNVESKIVETSRVEIPTKLDSGAGKPANEEKKLVAGQEQGTTAGAAFKFNFGASTLTAVTKVPQNEVSSGEFAAEKVTAHSEVADAKGAAPKTAEGTFRFTFGAATISATTTKTERQIIEPESKPVDAPVADSPFKFGFGIGQVNAAANEASSQRQDSSHETAASSSFKFSFGASTLSVASRVEPQKAESESEPVEAPFKSSLGKSTTDIEAKEVPRTSVPTSDTPHETSLGSLFKFGVNAAKQNESTKLEVESEASEVPASDDSFKFSFGKATLAVHSEKPKETAEDVSSQRPSSSFDAVTKPVQSESSFGFNFGATRATAIKTESLQSNTAPETAPKDAFQFNFGAKTLTASKPSTAKSDEGKESQPDESKPAEATTVANPFQFTFGKSTLAAREHSVDEMTSSAVETPREKSDSDQKVIKEQDAGSGLKFSFGTSTLVAKAKAVTEVSETTNKASLDSSASQVTSDRSEHNADKAPSTGHSFSFNFGSSVIPAQTKPQVAAKVSQTTKPSDVSSGLGSIRNKSAWDSTPVIAQPQGAAARNAGFQKPDRADPNKTEQKIEAAGEPKLAVEKRSLSSSETQAGTENKLKEGTSDAAGSGFKFNFGTSTLSTTPTKSETVAKSSGSAVSAEAKPDLGLSSFDFATLNKQKVETTETAKGSAARSEAQPADTNFGSFRFGPAPTELPKQDAKAGGRLAETATELAQAFGKPKQAALADGAMDASSNDGSFVVQFGNFSMRAGRSSPVAARESDHNEVESSVPKTESKPLAFTFANTGPIVPPPTEPSELPEEASSMADIPKKGRFVFRPDTMKIELQESRQTPAHVETPKKEAAARGFGIQFGGTTIPVPSSVPASDSSAVRNDQAASGKKRVSFPAEIAKSGIESETTGSGETKTGSASVSQVSRESNQTKTSEKVFSFSFGNSSMNLGAKKESTEPSSSITAFQFGTSTSKAASAVPTSTSPDAPEKQPFNFQFGTAKKTDEPEVSETKKPETSSFTFSFGSKQLTASSAPAVTETEGQKTPEPEKKTGLVFGAATLAKRAEQSTEAKSKPEPRPSSFNFSPNANSGSSASQDPPAPFQFKFPQP